MSFFDPCDPALCESGLDAEDRDKEVEAHPDRRSCARADRFEEEAQPLAKIVARCKEDRARVGSGKAHFPGVHGPPVPPRSQFLSLLDST